MDGIKLLLYALFEKAKHYDDVSEWEFIQTIMRDKNSNNMYTASQVIDHEDIFDALKSDEKNNIFRRQVLEENIMSASVFIKIGNVLNNSFDEMIRIRLLTYAYVTEIKYIQNVIANLLWISIGGNFYPDPFDGAIVKKILTPDEINTLSSVLGIDANSFNTLSKTEKRFKLICFLCEKAGLIPLKTFIESFYNNHFRNSISHSKYFVSENGYVGIDDNCEIRLSKTELSEKIDKCIMFFISLNELLIEYNTNYKGIVSIKGRKINYDKNNIDTGDIVDIDIIARPQGGIVNTIIKFNSTGHSSNDDDEFYKEIIKFMQEFEYDPNNDI